MTATTIRRRLSTDKLVDAFTIAYDQTKSIEDAVRVVVRTVADCLAPSGDSPEVRAILLTASKELDVSLGDIRGPRRTKEISAAREVAAYLLRMHGLSFPGIGKSLGGRHHSTIMQAVARVRRKIAAGECWQAVALSKELRLGEYRDINPGI